MYGTDDYTGDQPKLASKKKRDVYSDAFKKGYRESQFSEREKQLSYATLQNIITQSNIQDAKNQLKDILAGIMRAQAVVGQGQQQLPGVGPPPGAAPDISQYVGAPPGMQPMPQDMGQGMPQGYDQQQPQPAMYGGAPPPPW
jgi:hypothetical protein